MFENIAKFFKKLVKSEVKETPSKDTAKERLHLVLMQDRANVSADFLELMKQEIIEVIKRYIDVEESAIDVRLTNEVGEDGTTGAPSLYANIPIKNIKNSAKKEIEDEAKEKKQEEKVNEENKESTESKESKEDENKSEKNENEEENSKESEILESEDNEQKNVKEDIQEESKENEEKKES